MGLYLMRLKTAIW